MKRYVQHKSGQGEKWRVLGTCSGDRWFVSNPDGPDLQLPKREYLECEPPERWEDVTEECEVEFVTNDRVRVMLNGENILRQAQNCRVRKVKLYTAAWYYHGDEQNRHPIHGSEQWAFIVEKKVQP